MKYTKDVMRSQQSDQEIREIVSTLVEGLHPTHIAISIPMDASGDYPGSPPSPRTAREFTQAWADAIHGSGAKIIWRGTWSGIEGIYDFTKRDGADRFPAGTAASAASDGDRTWLGKTYRYITGNPTFFADGDIWAPLPERTEGIFQDDTSFLPHSGNGIQANYAAFFNDLKTVSDRAFQAIGKNVTTGWTANNYTEVASTWLPGSIFDTAGIVSIDHYGSDQSVREMEENIRSIHARTGKQVFLQEWGDYWNQGMAMQSRLTYLNNMYGMLQKLSDEGVLAGFNYWGGWDNDWEGILSKSGNEYSLNDRGRLLGLFYADNAQAAARPFATGTLVNDRGTVYLIMGESRLPFTNYEAFAGLGFSRWPMAAGDTSSYRTPQSYVLTSGQQQHPWGTWVLHEGTVYYSHESGLLGVPTMEVFLSNGGRTDRLINANSSDVAVIRDRIITASDPIVIR